MVIKSLTPSKALRLKTSAEREFILPKAVNMRLNVRRQKIDERNISSTSKLVKLVFCLFDMINEQGLPLYNDESDFFNHTR